MTGREDYAAPPVCFLGKEVPGRGAIDAERDGLMDECAPEDFAIVVLLAPGGGALREDMEFLALRLASCRSSRGDRDKGRERVSEMLCSRCSKFQRPKARARRRVFERHGERRRREQGYGAGSGRILGDLKGVA